MATTIPLPSQRSDRREPRAATVPRRLGRGLQSPSTASSSFNGEDETITTTPMTTTNPTTSTSHETPRPAPFHPIVIIWIFLALVSTLLFLRMALVTSSRRRQRQRRQRSRRQSSVADEREAMERIGLYHLERIQIHRRALELLARHKMPDFERLLRQTTMQVRQEDLVKSRRHDDANKTDLEADATPPTNSISKREQEDNLEETDDTSSSSSTTKDENNPESGTDQLLRLPMSAMRQRQGADEDMVEVKHRCQMVSGECAICLSAYRVGEKVSWASAAPATTAPGEDNADNATMMTTTTNDDNQNKDTVQMCLTHAFHQRCFQTHAESTYMNAVLNGSAKQDAESSAKQIDCPLCRQAFLILPPSND